MEIQAREKANLLEIRDVLLIDLRSGMRMLNALSERLEWLSQSEPIPLSETDVVFRSHRDSEQRSDETVQIRDQEAKVLPEAEKEIEQAKTENDPKTEENRMGGIREEQQTNNVVKFRVSYPAGITRSR